MSEISLSIDVGPGRVYAVCRFSSGVTMPLFFDEQPFLCADVYVDAAGVMTVGETPRAGADRVGVIRGGVGLIGGPPVEVGGRLCDPVDVLAVIIARCVREASLSCGRPVGELRLTVPPWWGPRHQGLMRAAAGRAGFADVVVLSAAVAAAIYATRTVGVAVPVAGLLLVCAVGAGTATGTVLHRRGDRDWEQLTQLRPPPVAAASRLAGARPVVRPAPARPVGPAADGDRPVGDGIAMPQPGSRGDVSAADGGLTAGVGVGVVVRAVVEAIDAADIDASMLSGVVCVGLGVHGSDVDAAISDLVGVTSSVLPRAAQATVLGCANAAERTAERTAPQWAPVAAADIRMSQTAVLAAAGVASVVLLAQMLAGAYVSRIGGYVDYVLADRGEFGLACLLAMLMGITAGRAVLLIRVAMLAEHPGSGVGRERAQQVIAVSVGFGAVFCVIYALTAGLSLSQPAGDYLRLAAIAVLPVGLCAGWVALILPRLAYLGGGALRQLAFPLVPIVLAGVGVATVQYAYNTSLTQPVVDVVGRVGGAITAAACVWLLTSQRRTRLVAIPLLAVVGALAAKVQVESVYGYAFIACTDLWWLIRTAAVTVDAFPQLRTRPWTRLHTAHTATPAPIYLGHSTPPTTPPSSGTRPAPDGSPPHQPPTVAPPTDQPRDT